MRLFLCLVVLAATLASPAAAAERRCGGTNATIYADSVDDTYLACAGAADAVAFLSQQGLTVDTVMRIDILDTVFLHQEESPSFRILGQFDAKQNRILVTSTQGQRQMAAEKPIFGVPYEEALFRSVVAHEVAHAIAEDNFHVVEPTRLAHEYIAYIVQLATMPPQLRQRVLGLLAREKDGFAQRKLLQGLENPEKALVPPEKALQLLSYDIHADAYPVARKIVKKPPNANAKREALPCAPQPKQW